jgi:DNA repair protein RadC
MKFEKFIYKQKIKDIPKELLPREKALKYGISSLSDSELLALSIGKGTKELNVLGLSNKLLSGKSLKEIKDIKLEDLLKIKGIGKAKALQILSIFEIAKRIENEEEKVVFSKPSDVFKYVKFLSKERQEKLISLYTNTSNELLGMETIAVGSLNVLRVLPRDIFYPAINLNAYGIILVHNHPNGNAEPSQEDINFTQKIQNLSIQMGFELLDHIIVGKKDFYSFNQHNLI